MTTVPIISTVPEPFSTVILLALLIAAFYIAFRVMEMVMETVIVSVISGVFYLALVYILPDFSFALDTLVFYTFAGSALYMGFSFLVSAYSIASTILEIPYRALMFVGKPLVNEVKEAVEGLKESEITDESSEEEEPGETKEVVLNKLNQED